MAKQETIRIDKTKIVKMGIYCNEKTRYSLDKVYNNLKKEYPNNSIYICNCGFFNMKANWSACFGLKADGIEYASNWNMPFIGINDSSMELRYAGSSSLPYKNAVSAYPILLENGKQSSQFSTFLGTGNHGRTMLGYNAKEIIVSVIEDTTGTDDFTLYEEVSYMQRQGADVAINLDGGGSSQCNFNGKKIVSSRCVHNMFYIITQQDAELTPKTTTTSNIKVGQVIKLKSTAKYTNGKSIPAWVINSITYARAINGNEITFSLVKSGAITGVTTNDHVDGVTCDGTETVTSTQPSTTYTTTTTSATQVKDKLFKIGDTFKLKSDAKYTNGKAIPLWVRLSTLYVRGIGTNVIAFSVLKTGAITGNVSVDYIQ